MDLQRTPDHGNILNGETRHTQVRMHHFSMTFKWHADVGYYCSKIPVACCTILVRMHHFMFCLLQDMALVVANPKEPESEEKPQKSLNEKQQVSLLMHVILW